MKLLFIFLCAGSVACSDTASLRQRIISAVDVSGIYTVLPTGSMKPTFDENYLLLARYLPFENVQVGDVILVRHVLNGEKLLVCHRVVRKSSRGSFLMTKGDANEKMDTFYTYKENYVCTIIGFIKI